MNLINNLELTRHQRVYAQAIQIPDENIIRPEVESESPEPKSKPKGMLSRFMCSVPKLPSSNKSKKQKKVDEVTETIPCVDATLTEGDQRLQYINEQRILEQTRRAQRQRTDGGKKLQRKRTRKIKK